eukprot:TRINITY_DN21050_c0_g1_i1.p1 TRINITY_DN21050_c0_g1~~TRINITY_DN21050_c0_g1_i1.p1  ORF type:complete len:385 (-),score=57.16 TRINITY_DN21050_c0_g1_i1:83-1237(-)
MFAKQPAHSYRAPPFHTEHFLRGGRLRGAASKPCLSFPEAVSSQKDASRTLLGGGFALALLRLAKHSHGRTRRSVSIRQLEPSLWENVRWTSLTDQQVPASHECTPTVEGHDIPTRQGLPVLPTNFLHLPAPNHEFSLSQKGVQAVLDYLLLQGKREFVVTLQREGQLAQVGLVFHLDNVRSAPAGNGTVCIAQHTALQRASIAALRSNEHGFLLADVELLGEDTQEAEPEAVNRLRKKLSEIQLLQLEVREEPRLSADFPTDHFWNLCEALGALRSCRLHQQVKNMNAEVSEAAQAWLQHSPERQEAFRRDRKALPASIFKKQTAAKEMYSEGSQEIQAHLQGILQTESLKERCILLAGHLEAEYQRLLAKKSLRLISIGLAD